jgi:Muconolactone delta-isomerase
MPRLERFIGVTALALIIMGLMASTPPSVAAQGENMLYLVEFEATDAGAPTSREQAIELLDKLIVPSLESLAKDGKIRAGGVVVGARAGVFVVGAKSHDEVTELVRALPAWGLLHWKVTPLETFAHRVDIEKKVVQGLRAQK